MFLVEIDWRIHRWTCGSLNQAHGSKAARLRFILGLSNTWCITFNHQTQSPTAWVKISNGRRAKPLSWTILTESVRVVGEVGTPRESKIAETWIKVLSMLVEPGNLKMIDFVMLLIVKLAVIKRFRNNIYERKNTFQRIIS